MISFSTPRFLNKMRHNISAGKPERSDDASPFFCLELKQREERPMKRCFACLVFLTLLYGVTPMTARDDTAQTKPKEAPVGQEIKVKTELMEVRTVVTDRKGRIIENLTKEDFELLENDQPQDISFFSISQVEGEPSKQTTEKAVAQDKDAALQRARDRLSKPPVRTTLLFVDSLHLTFSSLNRVKSALRRFIKERLTDQDVVALVASSQTLGIAQQFTRDRQLLNYAVERIQFSPLRREDLFPPTLAAEVLSDRIDAVRLAVDVERQVHHFECGCDLLRSFARNDALQILAEASYTRKATLSILEDFAEQMVHLPGKRMIVIFSDGFTLHDSDSGLHTEQLQPAIDRAVRSGVVIYSIDAKGVASLPTIDASRNVRRTNVEGYERDASLLPGPSGADSDEDTARKQAEIEACRDAPYCPQDAHYCDPRCFIPRLDQWPTVVNLSEREEQNGLYAIADQTGGSMYTNHNELDVPLGQAFNANRFYYVLSYYLQAGSGDKQFRSIKVRVRNHPEYTVRTARGFSPADTRAEAEAAKTPQQRLLRAMSAPLPVTDLGVSAQADFVETETDDKQVTLTAYFDGDRFQYRQKDQRNVFGLEILYAVYDASGKQVEGISANVEGTLTSERLAQAKTSGYRFSRRLALKPGIYQMHVGVREEGTDRMGTAATWIEVPELEQKKLEISSLMLRDPLDTDPATADGIHVSELEQIEMVQGIPLYTRDDFCDYSFRVHQSASPAPEKGVVWMSELLRDGKQVRQEPWKQISREDRILDGKGWFDVDGEVDLSGLDPGVYELRVRTKEDQSDRTIQRTAIFAVE
jgi:VWFA-related protein